jgi:putative transposase
MNSERDRNVDFKSATSPAALYTIIIGGNIVSRGVTFENLLSMFFTRDAKHKIQQDTYIQRARMFGSRKAHVPYFELTIPNKLYLDWHLVAALGIDAEGNKHPLGLIEGATENAATARALIDNLIERGLDPEVCRLFIVDGAKALSKVIRSTFGRHTPIQRCQIHKARNVIERLPKALHASVRKALRQAWELDDADKAERLLRSLARRLEQEAPGVAASLLEGLDEMLTVNRLGLPAQLRRSLACTNGIENMIGTVRRVCHNVKRWRNAAMALRWTAAGMMEAVKGFRRLKARKQLPILKAALAAHQAKHTTKQKLEESLQAA